MSTNFDDEPKILSDWISQAEAARLHGVTRQAIHKLVQNGRLRSQVIGGHSLVSLSDLRSFSPQTAGRPKLENSKRLDRIVQELDQCTPEIRRQVFDKLRKEFPIDKLEEEFGASAEIILAAIRRSTDITKRGIKGILAEAYFESYVIEELSGWKISEIEGNQSYDFELRDALGAVRVQIKLQRSRKGSPDIVLKSAKNFLEGMYKVEMQKTRGGEDKKTGKQTRPYKFGDFDILAVSMYPSKQLWSCFHYTVADWLYPKPNESSGIDTFQPVAPAPNDDWTDEFLTAVEWLRSKREKTIKGHRDKKDNDS